MIVQPKPAYFRGPPESIKMLPSAEDLYIECEVTSPGSWKGRTVYVRIPREQMPAILKTARDSAIRARSKPMDNG